MVIEDQIETQVGNHSLHLIWTSESGCSMLHLIMESLIANIPISKHKDLGSAGKTHSRRIELDSKFGPTAFAKESLCFITFQLSLGKCYIPYRPQTFCMSKPAV